MGRWHRIFPADGICPAYRPFTVLIAALPTGVGKMTQGERRIAERLDAKLDETYRVWYDVPA